MEGDRNALSRRTFLAATVATAVSACSGDHEDTALPAVEPTATDLTPTPEATATPQPTSTPVPLEPPAAGLPTNPFNLGVASGDPGPSSVILWTRLTLDSPGTESISDDTAPVLWEVATDDTFAEVVASGIVEALPALGHSIHVDADGLEPSTPYVYRFRVDSYASPVGRTRTAPARESSPQELTFAFSSCQHYETGFYAAHRHLVDEDADFFVFLGDYIYEGGPASAPLVDPATGEARVHTSAEATDLDAYRERYALYRSDPDLQAHHAARPWIITWDDHEVQNNYAGDHAALGDDPEPFRARRAAAYQAWYEHMPVRLEPPEGPDYQIYRDVSWGNLAQFFVLDGRQYRDDQATDGEYIPLLGDDTELPVRTLGPTALDPGHTMLGPEQEDWLLDRVASSGAIWSVLAQQVMMHGLSIVPGQDPPLVVTDTWDGYYGNRRRMLQALPSAGAENLVVLTGDFHSASAGDLKPDPFDSASPVVGTEFMASAISSGFPDLPEGAAELIAAFNPQIAFFDTRNGYAVCRVTPEAWTTSYRALHDVTDPDTSIETIATFAVAAGTPGAVPG